MGSQRNLLIILTGGQRGDALGGAGIWPVDTPHLDRLASEGLAVTAISPSISPEAALWSVYTGLHPRQHGVWRRDGRHVQRSFVHCLRQAGYHTMGVGRVGLIADELDEQCIVADVDQLDPAGCQYLQFAERRGLIRRVEQQRRQRLRSGLFEATGAATAEADEDVDAYIAAQAVTMLEQLQTADASRPWAMVVAFTGPGNDLPAPSMYFDAVAAEKLANGFIPAAMSEVDRYAQLNYPRHLLQYVSTAKAAAMRRHYLGRVMLIDCCVGMLRQAANRRSDARATWTVLTSDRGAVLGERGLFGCRSFVGSGAYVPIWVTPPEAVDVQQAGDQALRDDDELVSGVDFAATICALAGTDAPAGCTGQSLLEGFGRSIGRPAVMSEDERMVLLHTMRHKAVYESATGELRMLFDLKHDMEERKNLADSPYHANVTDQLQAKLAMVLLPLGAGDGGGISGGVGNTSGGGG